MESAAHSVGTSVAEVVAPSRVLRTYGLFAGIGGIERGLERAGHKTVGLCEKDPAARAVLRHHFRDVPITEDVRKLKTLPPDIDLLCAGFPCQDLSQMGSGRGLDGRRSGLVREVFRLMEQSDVPYVLFENVRFMLHLGQGAAMRYILRRLEHLGYKWAYRVVDTRAFGLPQKRERVLILASKTEDPRSVLLEQNRCPPTNTEDRQPCGFYWTEGRWGIGWVQNGIPTLKGSSAFGIPCPPAVVTMDNAIVIPGIADAECLQGFPRGWTSAATSVEARRGTQWRLINNAVSVPVAQWVGKRLRVALPSGTFAVRRLRGRGKASRHGQSYRSCLDEGSDVSQSSSSKTSTDRI